MYRSSSPITAEYKLLQLQQYLSVEVQKAIENLGHSAVAYQIAREILEKTFCGQCRHMAICLEELENLRPVKFGNSRDLEQFSKWKKEKEWKLKNWEIIHYILGYKRSCQN